MLLRRRRERARRLALRFVFFNNFDGFVVVGDNFICVYFIEVLFHHFVAEEEEKKYKKVSFKIWCCSFCS